MLILLTNDDGIAAPGLAALEAAFAAAGYEVAVAAPVTEKSGSSHAVSLRRPLQIDDLAPARWAVHGTPVDCVNVAVNHLLLPRRPALVVSGINKGANLGCDIHYSGTVGAAREGCLLGLPALAISLQTDADHPDFTPAANYAVSVARRLNGSPLPLRTFLNINLPGSAPAGHLPIPESDLVAIESGFISVTPLRLDTTAEGVMEWVKGMMNSE
jgi:5'-nucleotidase